MNKFIITGNISNINKILQTNQGKSFCWFDLCTSEKVMNSIGEEIENKNFFSIKIYEKQLKEYESLLKIGSWVTIEGPLQTYFDKNNKKITYLTVFKMIDMTKEMDKSIISSKTNCNNNKIISYDNDGVMLWHGKRCESNIVTAEEEKQMKELLNEYV